MNVNKEELHCWVDECVIYAEKGRVASYIPAIASAPKNVLGVAVCDLTGNIVEAFAGENRHIFTLQSISKVFTLLLALEDRGPEAVFEKVGMEPTGDPFNSIVKLETLEPTKPLNPMINAGAITVCHLVKGDNPQEKFLRIREFIRKIAGNPDIDYDREVFHSEKETGHRNRALAFFLKDTGNIAGNVEDVLDIYFKQCALKVSCNDLAYMGAFLAGDGRLPKTGERFVRAEYCKMAKAFMVTCGLYNGSGEFAIKVGIPAKSGVSGGIMAAVPETAGIGVVGPALDKKGNSIAGVELLKKIAKEYNLSIF